MRVAPILHELLHTERFDCLADLVDALKTRLSRYRLAWTNDTITAALRIVARSRPLLERRAGEGWR